MVDSLAASLGLGLLVHKAVCMKEDGSSLEEIAAWLEENKLNLVHNFTVDDLNHLHRGGRVSKTSAVLGTALGIKPILHVDDEGHLIALSKVRGRKASLKALVDRMAELTEGWENPDVFISHGDCLEDAQFVADDIRKRFGINNITIGYVGPVIGSHTGAGVVPSSSWAASAEYIPKNRTAEGIAFGGVFCYTFEERKSGRMPL